MVYLKGWHQKKSAIQLTTHAMLYSMKSLYFPAPLRLHCSNRVLDEGHYHIIGSEVRSEGVRTSQGLLIREIFILLY